MMFKNKVTICGYLNESKKNEYLISEFSMKNCETGEYILDTHLEAMETFLIKAFKDSIVINEMQWIPDSLMNNQKLVPLCYQTLKISPGGKIIMGAPKFIFKKPKLSLYQKKYLDSICDYLRAKKTSPKTLYPLDDNSIYGLFLGALWKYGDSYDLFVNIDKYFLLDGAIAETNGAIPFEYIMNKLGGKKK